MLIWLISYPRSGNSWMQEIIKYKFGYLPTYSIPRHTAKEFSDKFPEWNIRREVLTDKDFSINRQSLHSSNTRIYHYNSPYLKDNESLQLIIPKISDYRISSFRKQLASGKNPYFLKGHILRHWSKLFPGEYIILMIRHPGASLWSLYNFLLSKNEMSSGLTIEEAIEGKTRFKSWSCFYNEWSEIIERTSVQTILIRYEDLQNDFKGCCNNLESFLGLKLLTNTIPKFRDLHIKDPIMFRSGDPDEWKNKLNEEQRRMLFKLHWDTMRMFGYIN